MSDLDKLMQNLKKNKEAVEETPQETEEVKDADDDDHEDEEIFDDDDDQEEEVEEMKPLPKKIEVVKEKPKAEIKDDDDQNPVEHEVALLQNEGIFRRELLLTLKELVDVQKVNAQVMIDIKKAVTGEKNAK